MPYVVMPWLAEHVELPDGLTAEQLAADLVRVGLEEEAIHSSGVVGPVVVGRVLAKDPEPQKNGKVINWCQVDTGERDDAGAVIERGVICGAHNFEVGDAVVVALPGAVLPGDFAIAARKTYGHVSNGMICASDELGMEPQGEGIIVLATAAALATDPDAAPAPGTDALALLGLADEVLEINVTPDRGYCFSVRGVAREFAHSTGARFTDPGLAAPAGSAPAVPHSTEAPFAVEIHDDAPLRGQAGCDRFVTRIVRGIDPSATSPDWLARRLRQAGMRPISLAVDATNYVMLDLGQPLHAYDLAQVNEPIVVRRSRAGERITTLDGVDRALDPEDLLITDSPQGQHGSRPIGIAGVMGGASTEVSEQTSDVLIEAAHFSEVTIARSARRHKLPSEASKRFERGVDPRLPGVAAQAVVDLLVEYGGGVAGPEVFDLNETTAPVVQDFPVAEVERLAGLQVSENRVKEILTDIGCLVSGSGAVLQVTPPTWRPDLVGPAHFVEEIARLVGYDEIPSILPSAPAGNGLTVVQRQRRDVLRALAEQGWVQVLSYPFVSADTFEKQGLPADDKRRVAVKLINPLQDEAGYLRTSVLDSLLATAQLNVSRGNPAVAVCEASLVAHPCGIAPAVPAGVGARPSDEELAKLHGAIPNQPHHIAGVACGPVTQPQAGFEAITWDWRDAVEATLIIGRTVGLDLEVKAAEQAPWHPGRCAAVLAGGAVVGYAGELAPAVCKAFELSKRSVAFEIDSDALFAARGDVPAQVAPVLTYPAAKEDVALVVDESVTAAELAAVVRQAAGELLEDLRLFDVYVGSQVPEGKKSLAFALRLRGDHTLTAEETAGVRKRIVKQTRKKFGAELRG